MADQYQELLDVAQARRAELQKEMLVAREKSAAENEAKISNLVDAQIRSALQAFAAGSNYWTPSYDFQCNCRAPEHDKVFTEVERLTGITRGENDDGEWCFNFAITLD